MWLPETRGRQRVARGAGRGGRHVHVLAPHQAPAWRPLDTGGLGGRRARDRSEPRLPLAAALAASAWPSSSTTARSRRPSPSSACSSAAENLVAWLSAGLHRTTRTWPQLVHSRPTARRTATTSRFGEMALACALHADRSRRHRDRSRTTREFLAAHPPTHEVEIHEETSWSCAHGIERWRADCGCRGGGDWHQRWRAPLREALDWLRDADRPTLEARGSALFTDPWAARDDYVEVLLDRRPERSTRSSRAHAAASSTPAARVEALRLLELAAQPAAHVHARAAGSSTRSRASSPCRSSATRRWRCST